MASDGNKARGGRQKRKVDAKALYAARAADRVKRGIGQQQQAINAFAADRDAAKSYGNTDTLSPPGSPFPAQMQSSYAGRMDGAPYPNVPQPAPMPQPQQQQGGPVEAPVPFNWTDVTSSLIKGTPLPAGARQQLQRVSPSPPYEEGLSPGTRAFQRDIRNFEGIMADGEPPVLAPVPQQQGGGPVAAPMPQPQGGRGYTQEYRIGEDGPGVGGPIGAALTPQARAMTGLPEQGGPELLGGNAREQSLPGGQFRGDARHTYGPDEQPQGRAIEAENKYGRKSTIGNSYRAPSGPNGEPGQYIGDAAQYDDPRTGRPGVRPQTQGPVPSGSGVGGNFGGIDYRGPQAPPIAQHPQFARQQPQPRPGLAEQTPQQAYNSYGPAPAGHTGPTARMTAVGERNETLAQQDLYARYNAGDPEAIAQISAGRDNSPPSPRAQAAQGLADRNLAEQNARMPYSAKDGRTAEQTGQDAISGMYAENGSVSGMAGADLARRMAGPMAPRGVPEKQGLSPKIQARMDALSGKTQMEDGSVVPTEGVDPRLVGKYSPKNRSQLPDGAESFTTKSGNIGLYGHPDNSDIPTDENGRPIRVGEDGKDTYGRKGPLRNRYDEQVARHAAAKQGIRGRQAINKGESAQDAITRHSGVASKLREKQGKESKLLRKARSFKKAGNQAGYQMAMSELRKTMGGEQDAGGEGNPIKGPQGVSQTIQTAEKAYNDNPWMKKVGVTPEMNASQAIAQISSIDDKSNFSDQELFSFRDYLAGMAIGTEPGWKMRRILEATTGTELRIAIERHAAPPDPRTHTTTSKEGDDTGRNVGNDFPGMN